MPLKPNTLLQLIAFGALLLPSAVVYSASATYPSRPIRIVTSEAGGGGRSCGVLWATRSRYG